MHNLLSYFQLKPFANYARVVVENLKTYVLIFNFYIYIYFFNIEGCYTYNILKFKFDGPKNYECFGGLVKQKYIFD